MLLFRVEQPLQHGEESGVLLHDSYDPELFQVFHRGVGGVDQQLTAAVEFTLGVPREPKNEACPKKSS